MLRLFGIIEINALKIAEKALATLGAFSTILRALISIIPQNVTLIPYYRDAFLTLPCPGHLKQKAFRVC